jgi:hypothetical protein
MSPTHRRRIALLCAVVLFAAAGYILTRSNYDPPAKSATPLGVTRQAILARLERVYKLQPVEKKPTLYVVKLSGSIATVAIQGPPDAPNMANVTAIYSKETAPVLATAGSLLSLAILGSGEWYGPWSGQAIHKCEPGFDIVGQYTNTTGVFEVRMSKRDLNGESVLSVVFRRLR